MDLETLEKEEEKPKTKRGRKKKEIVEEWGNSGILEGLKPMSETSPIPSILEPNQEQQIDEIVLNEEKDVKMIDDWLDQYGNPAITEKVLKESEEFIKENEITEEKLIPIPLEPKIEQPPIRPSKLTYTKPNVSIDRL